MKIVFVSDSIYPYLKGGKEKRLYEISTRLARLGHDVHIYTMHWWDSSEETIELDGLTLHAISKLHVMYDGDRRSIKAALLFSLSCLKLMRIDFDILDVDHMPFFPIYAAWFVCLLRGKKMHGTWHEALTRQDWVDYMGAAGNIATIIERISIHMPYAVTAASIHTEQLIRTELKRTKRLSIVASGIDTKLIASLKPAKVSCDVLYTGRLVKDKNVDKLIDAVAILVRKNPKLRCVIIGHGIEKQNILDQIERLKLEKHITMLEPLAEAKDVYSYMKAAKVFCLPSVREGFGIVALEALGCGTPVVTVDTAANASKDLITQGVNGSIVTLTPNTLAAAIQSWLDKPKPTNIAKQFKSYDWDNLARKQAEVYSA